MAVAVSLALLAGVLLAVVLGALLFLGRRPRPLHVVGAALLAYPVARALVAAALVSHRLGQYTVLLPAAPRDFELGIVHDVAFNLLLPLAGALLLWRSRAGQEPFRGPRDLAASLRKTLEPVGLRLGADPRQGLLDAAALLGVTMLLQGAALLAEGTFARVLVTGDESAYWSRITPGLLIGISLAAGITEEFVWRGALLRALLQRASWIPAIAAQALLFGFIHAGYGNWAHVVGPALFGALMGFVALRVSLLAAMVVHVGIDIMYVALAAPQLQPAILVLPAAMLGVGLAALVLTRGQVIRRALAPVSARLPRSLRLFRLRPRQGR